MSTTFESDWENTRLKERIAELEREIDSLTGQRDRQIDTCATRENEIIALEKECDQLREQVKMLLDAATRAHRKLSAYVGVCTGDKELTNTIIPMLKEALAATEQK